MDYRLLGFFSGFPNHSFPSDVAERLRGELTQRGSLIFVSAWPAEYAVNDRDAVGMHGMFEEIGLSFAQHHVIDNRMEFSHATRLVHEASCVFLMGGHPGLQLRLLRETGLDKVICNTPAILLGVSAGAINMAKKSLDTKESPVPYQGLGLADITVKPHFEPKDQHILSSLLTISMNLPICAMEDNSAIFVLGDQITSMGNIHWIHQGKICPLWQGGLLVQHLFVKL
jgi:peptidase E